MAGFHSIRDAYLFYQADELERIFEEQANTWLKEYGSIPSKGGSPCDIMTEAASLRIETDEEELKYAKKIKH